MIIPHCTENPNHACGNMGIYCDSCFAKPQHMTNNIPPMQTKEEILKEVNGTMQFTRQGHKLYDEAVVVKAMELYAQQQLADLTKQLGEKEVLMLEAANELNRASGRIEQLEIYNKHKDSLYNKLLGLFEDYFINMYSEADCQRIWRDFKTKHNL